MSATYGARDLRFAKARARHLSETLAVASLRASNLAKECGRETVTINAGFLALVLDSVSVSICSAARNSTFYEIIRGFSAVLDSLSMLAGRSYHSRVMRRKLRLVDALEMARSSASDLMTIADLASVSDHVNLNTQVRIGHISSLLDSAIDIVERRGVADARRVAYIFPNGVVDAASLRDVAGQILERSNRAKNLLAEIISEISADFEKAAKKARPRSRRVSAMALVVVRLGFYFLPKMQRPRQAAEVESQLWELASSNGSMWRQLTFAANFLARVPLVRYELRRPRRRGALP